MPQHGQLFPKICDVQVGPQLKLLQLNVDKISKAKSDLLSKIAYDENNIDILLLQETACRDENDLSYRGDIQGFNVAAAVHSSAYGIATYVKNTITDYNVIFQEVQNNTFLAVITTQGLFIIKIYKPPATQWTHDTILCYDYPTIYI